ncbi:MAG: hypothetical protein LBD73_08600, partial [Deferribacteraceae bacterium]|nr:hypothetical protein [Deferribacteraceae bacterium]
WACDDGIDERASFATAYVSAVPSAGNDINFDIVVGRNNDNGTPDNTTDDSCEKFLWLEGAFQTINFIVEPNPNSTSASIGHIMLKATKVDIRAKPSIQGVPPPAIPSFIYGQSYSLAVTDGGTEEGGGGYIVPIKIPLFDESQLQEVLDHLKTTTSALYEVRYKFKLLELSTGIEEDLESGGFSLIQVMDVVNLPEGQECVTSN